jgi:hypothetical protein
MQGSIMNRNRRSRSLAVLFAASLAWAAPTMAQDMWAGQTFLSDYSTLQPAPKSQGKDFVYLAPHLEDRAGKYTKVMFDQPEVFLSPSSPYKGAKPDDLSAISELIRSTTVAALQQRGYAIVETPGPDTLYVRSAVTDLQIVKKSRSLLAYTPVGFVVDTAVKALQAFMDKYNIVDMALQVEIQDSTTREVLAEAVLKRGRSADVNKPIPFEAMVVAANELGERFACRLDNGHVPAAQRIDCTDPIARKARPKVVGN